MKFCPHCKRLIPRGRNNCPVCNKDIVQKKPDSERSDKRKGFVRIPLDDFIRFQPLTLDPRGDNLILEGKARNISLSGVYFEIDKSSFIEVISYLKVSSILWMKFNLPGAGNTIKTQGEIRRVWDIDSATLGLGVMFVNISGSSHKILSRFLSSALEGKDEI
ncbi:MAG: PilZ domain-containing protein [Candidatus Omnitrophica bacterium]|nr:PilZ domain-containing protein [Candidatus Omnitrophota bacterium]